MAPTDKPLKPEKPPKKPAKPRPKRAKNKRTGQVMVVGKAGKTEDNLNGGGPSKLDEKAINTILGALRMGSHLEVACFLAELDPWTAKNWMLRGKEEPKSIYAKFLRRISSALAQGELSDLGVIDMAAKGRPAQYLMVHQVVDGKAVYDAENKPVMVPALDGEGKPIIVRAEQKPVWTAAAWKLERKAPKRWGRFDRIQIDDLESANKPQGGKPQTDEEKVDAGEVAARAKRVHKVLKVLESVPLEDDLSEV